MTEERELPAQDSDESPDEQVGDFADPDIDIVFAPNPEDDDE